MSVEWKLFSGGAAFAALVAGLYWFVSYEHAGTTMLIFSGAALLLVASYLVRVGNQSGPRPSDQDDADPGDEAALYGAGEAQYYPPSSVWPFVAAAGVMVLGFGMVFGLGVASLGVLLLGAAITGYAGEANAKR